MEIREIDPHDEDALRVWWEVGHAATVGRGWPQWPPFEVSRAALPRHNPERVKRFFTAYDGDSVVGALMFLLPRNDNHHLAFLEGWVVPERQREGIGAALLAHGEDLVRAEGRTTILIEAWSVPDGENSGRPFLEKHGYALANEEGVKALDLDDVPWQRLEDEVAAHIGDYRIVEWQIDTPPELVPGLCGLLSSFNSQIPLGEADIQDSDWTPERIAAYEASLHADGREVRTAGAVAPDGALVGYSDLRWTPADGRVALIGITQVDPAHRGHRLGLALKLATHRALRDAPDAPRIVITGNADVNAAMNQINEQMGYRIVEKSDEMQKRL